MRQTAQETNHLFFPIHPEYMKYFSSFIPTMIKEEYQTNPALRFYGITTQEQDTQEGSHESTDESGLVITAVGVVVIEEEGRQAELRYIYLEEGYRGRGIADRYMDKLIYMLWEKGIQRFVAHYSPEEVPQLRKLLKKQGFKMETESIGTFRFMLGDLEKEEVLKGTASHVISLSDCRPDLLRGFCQEIADRGEDFIELPIQLDQYISECSAVYQEEGVPKGLLLLEMAGEKHVRIPYLVSYTREPLALLEMIRFLYDRGMKQLTEDTLCEFHTLDPALTVAVEKFLRISAMRQESAYLDMTRFDEYEKMFDREMELLSFQMELDKQER